MNTSPTKLLPRFLAMLGLALVSVAPGFADPATLAKARAYLGPDAVLDSVQSLRFKGTLEVVDSGSETPGSARIEIVFKRPDRQIITATNGGQTEVTALDGYDAWQRVSDAADPASWQVTLLGPDQIKRLRANTFENLAFFRGIESRGGRIEDRGPVTIDGVACRTLAFVHAPDITFTRSFDIATGRLVLTETDSGTKIREKGEIRAGGLRFPKSIETVNPLPDGGQRTIRVTFDSVEVNPEIDPSIFSVPALRN